MSLINIKADYYAKLKSGVSIQDANKTIFIKNNGGQWVHYFATDKVNEPDWDAYTFRVFGQPTEHKGGVIPESASEFNGNQPAYYPALDANGEPAYESVANNDPVVERYVLAKLAFDNPADAQTAAEVIFGG